MTRNQASGIAAALAAAVLVAGCVAPPPRAQDTAAASAPATTETPPAPVPGAGPETALAPPPVPVRPRLQPEELEGAVREHVTSLLGDPDFRRDDPPAQLMQYRGAECILDVFLYAGAGGGPHRVAHVEARGRSVARVTGEDCLRSLLEERGRGAEAG